MLGPRGVEQRDGVLAGSLSPHTLTVRWWRMGEQKRGEAWLETRERTARLPVLKGRYERTACRGHRGHGR